MLAAIGVPAEDVEAWRARHGRLRDPAPAPAPEPTPAPGPAGPASARTTRRRVEIAAFAVLDLTSTNIGQNPNVASSALWLGALAPDGRVGYISEVYLAPAYRGGLGLPPC